MKSLFLHLAYVFLAIPFFLKNVMYIRYALECAFICFILWHFHNKMKDNTTLIWNIVFLSINTYLIIIELRQYNWNFFPVNPLNDLGKIYKLN